ncbi:hypothetical protein [Rhodovulum visakhapatnamense]|uniref:AAA domain-containing protein n=1 Tax=Rhodovulum visakhapatnamense TaxID=364297 RepID=A0A4R8FUT4_9RHOB|nr:hypothetical protein [Rhodovulum visakhapatnamense]TDX27928.1 hypothetical protein EV657_1133 [Rhodovulum visakhapatnamense]
MLKHKPLDPTVRSTMTEFSISRKTPGKTDFPKSHPACIVMAGWTTEDWEKLESFGDFPLLEICPEAPAYFAQAGHFSARDLRNIVSTFGLDVDHHDAEAIYHIILERAEGAPWVLPILETIIAPQRVKNGGFKNKNKVSHVLQKFPLSKLRLKANPHLHERTGELLLPPVVPDIAVAAFCEYAIEAYYQKIENKSLFEEHYIEARKILSDISPADIIMVELGQIDDIQDWDEHASLISSLMSDYPDAVSEHLHLHLIATLKHFSQHITQTSSADDLEGIMVLSGAAAKQAKLLQNPRKETVIEHVRKLGIEVDLNLVTDEAVATLSAALDAGLVMRVRIQDLAIADLEEKIAETKEAIAAANAEEDYALLTRLAPQAGEEKEALRVAREVQEAILLCLGELVSGTTEDQDAALAELRAFIEKNDPDTEDYAEADASLASELFTLPDAEENPVEDHTAADDVDPEDAVEDNSPIDATSVSSDVVNSDDPETAGHDQAEGNTSEPTVTDAYEEDTVEAQNTHAGIDENEGAAKEIEPQDVDPQPDADSVDIENPLEDAPIQSAIETAEDRYSEPEALPDLIPRIEPETYVAEIDIDTTPPVPVSVLASLIHRNLLGIAADAAKSFEHEGKHWPIRAVVLEAAAGSRTPHRKYGADTQRFLELATRGAGDAASDVGSILLLGALIRPALLETSLSSLRNILHELCRGSLGQHLQQATDAISELDYDFPPDADELASLSGGQRTPQKQRLAAQLGKWADTVSAKTSRWPFATAIMHHIASPAGPIGAALSAISNGNKNAASLAREAIDGLSSASKIETLAAEYASEAGRNTARLHPKGIEYLERQLEEPLGLLDSWIDATMREGSQGQKSEARLRTIVGNLNSRLQKAETGLRAEATSAPDTLAGATAHWVADQVREVLQALRGEDTGAFATLDEALAAERDLLPASVRDTLDIPEGRFDAFSNLLNKTVIPDPKGALAQAREEGAFDTASRLGSRFGIDVQDGLTHDMKVFAKTWSAEINTRVRRLKTLSKVDYKHQEEISRRLALCEILLGRLTAVDNGSEVHDLAELPAAAAEIDATCAQIEAKIRADQVQRIDQYRNDRNSEEADTLLGALDGITVEAAEDRIAQLRDGRSAAIFQTELGGLVSDFLPDFLAYANSAQWPTTSEALERTVAAAGPLHIEEDRRGAGLDLIHLYRAIGTSMQSKQPDLPKVKVLFEEIGYDSVKIHNPRPVGRSGLWQAQLGGRIQPLRSGDWFLPPVFGSQAANGAGAHLVLIGRDTLPENLVKTLSSDMPAILLFAGVIDAQRRRELAEHLRDNAIPALLIDETLITFAGTRRQARARTIFECGLPYGRVEPYTTDAGQLPPEMFFGRSEEIRLIMSKTADGCLVYGGRQLGKSALLGHIARTEHAPEKDRIVVTREVRPLGKSEKPSEIWSHLASMLSPEIVRPASRNAEDVSRDIKAWLMHHRQGHIVAMFDEADNFMDADTRDDYPELARLKKLMEESGRAFKVVFAGLHNVQRMSHQPNSPLAHLGLPICIGPLNRTEDDKRAAHDLVVSPMRAAGFRFENHEAIEEILAWANYYPSLIQEYMKGLLSTLHGSGSGKPYRLPEGDPLWPISSDTLFDHRGFGEIENRIRFKFHLTLNLDPRYALVAYTLGRLNVEGQEDKARVTGFDPRELLDEASTFWPRSSEIPALAAFEALLEELFDLGVLGRVPIPGTKRFRYLLGSRQVATMLGSEDDIYHALAEIEEKDPEVAYDRSVHRRRYKLNTSGNQGEFSYCPLTDLQIERIVQPQDATGQIVCGLEALGLSKVGSSLKRIAESGHLPGAPEQGINVEIVRSKRELRAPVERKGASQNPVILVFTPEDRKEAHDALTWLEHQPRVLNKQVRPLLLLDAANTEMRDIATRRPEQSQFLTAWGAEMIRIHLSHIEKVELDTKPMRSAILAAAGGIPSETIKLISAMRVAEDPLEVAREWKVSFRMPAGLLNGTLGKALSILDMGDDEDADTFNEILRDHAGADLVDIGPDLVATGLATWFKKKAGRIRRSALGDLLARETEK